MTDEEKAAAALKTVATIPARPVHAGDWEDVLHRAARPDRSWPALALVAVAMLIAVAAGLGWQRYQAPTLSPSREAKVAVKDDGAVALSWGRLEVKSRTPARLVTPHVVSVTAVGRVAAEVDSHSTFVEVFEGSASVRTDSETIELHAGESRRWPNAPALPASLRVSEAVMPGACDERPKSEQAGCWLKESRGDGLSAQVALYRRGALAESLRRFPAGVLHPEIRLGLLRQWIERNQLEAALREAIDFEQACPDDPRLDVVRALRRTLESRGVH